MKEKQIHMFKPHTAQRKIAQSVHQNIGVLRIHTNRSGILAYGNPGYFQGLTGWDQQLGDALGQFGLQR